MPTMQGNLKALSSCSHAAYPQHSHPSLPSTLAIVAQPSKCPMPEDSPMAASSWGWKTHGPSTAVTWLVTRSGIKDLEWKPEMVSLLENREDHWCQVYQPGDLCLHQWKGGGCISTARLVIFVFPFLTSATQMIISDLNCPPTEASALIHKGSHTPDPCVPLKYLRLYGMHPCQDDSEQGNLDLPALLSTFHQGCSML